MSANPPLVEVTVKRKHQNMNEVIETEVTIKALPDTDLDELQKRAEVMIARQMGLGRVNDAQHGYKGQIIYPEVLFRGFNDNVQVSDSAEITLESSIGTKEHGPA
jgi:hypothetical protein